MPHLPHRPRTLKGGAPGIALILAVLLVGLMFVMGMTLINLAGADYQIANNESRSIQALFNADAGIEEAKMRLSPAAPNASPKLYKIDIGVNPAWRAYISTDSDASTASQATLKGRIQAEDPTYVAGDEAQYTVYPTVQTANVIRWGWCRVEKKKNAAGSLVYLDVLTGAETTSADTTAAGVTYHNLPVLLVTSEGKQGPIRRMISMEFQPIVASTTTPTNVVIDPFSNSAHGKNKVEVTGNAKTDSYNSKNGAYNVGGNKGSNGDISTDATAAGSVAIGPNATVNGDVKAGPGADVATAVDNKGTVSGGTIGTEASTKDMPLSTIPAGVTNQGPLNISGQTPVTLTSGTYWFSSISITGQGKLIISGAVKIYVTGNINAGGNGIENGSGQPPNLLIYGTVDPNNSANKCTDVSYTGNAAFYGAVYAPDADIKMQGNADVYGALTGKTVKIQGSNSSTTIGFHYDEALGNLGQFTTTSYTTSYTTGGYSRYLWREIPF